METSAAAPSRGRERRSLQTSHARAHPGQKNVFCINWISILKKFACQTHAELFYLFGWLISLSARAGSTRQFCPSARTPRFSRDKNKEEESENAHLPNDTLRCEVYAWNTQNVNKSSQRKTTPASRKNEWAKVPQHHNSRGGKNHRKLLL